MKARKLIAALFAALVVLVLVATGVLGVLYGQARAQEQARTSALDAARLYAQKMYAWNPETISDNITFMMTHLTGQAKKEYEENVVTHRIAESVKQQQIVATVTDQGSGVIENTRTTARVLLFINQSASRATTEDIQVTPARIVYGMERRGDTWLVNDAQMIDDETLREAVEGPGEGDSGPRQSIPVSPPAGSSGPAAESAPPAEQIPAG
ncbi:hypothetical protein GOHSU_27_00160 [Gordonia hirsuta DSM 44140 = NBRC 16056]|uniref:Mce-associated membrane protein n=1 Tax=Gordonia hirsuta DSM 44140 = NBRC 16056 TaxID=1121927 RepID=L7L9R0_9ACTN|nr:hypothetical protein [Gordonia hirsuta]GAC57880.1 hypothetical protein GOHSU_27_00160 [Gordonia hirsuta DSM 44140 = NBRC 16056]